MVVSGGSVNHVFTVPSEAIWTSYGGRWDNRPDRLEDLVASSRAGIERALLS